MFTIKQLETIIKVSPNKVSIVQGRPKLNRLVKEFLHRVVVLHLGQLEENLVTYKVTTDHRDGFLTDSLKEVV